VSVGQFGQAIRRAARWFGLVEGGPLRSERQSGSWVDRVLFEPPRTWVGVIVSLSMTAVGVVLVFAASRPWSSLGAGLTGGFGAWTVRGALHIRRTRRHR
jgi:hypothetical protein